MIESFNKRDGVEMLLIIIMLRLITGKINKKLTSGLIFGIKNWKLPASEIDTAGLSGFL